MPARKQAGIEGFESGAYLTEARVPEDSKAVGATLLELEEKLDEAGAQVVGLVHNDVRLTAPNPRRKVRPGDILVIEAEADALATVLSSLGLNWRRRSNPRRNPETGEPGEAEGEAVENHRQPDGTTAGMDAQEIDDKAEATSEVMLMELAVLPASPVAGRSASDLLLRTRYGLNLLAVSRQGHRSLGRLRSMAIRSGDLLLMQGPPEALSEFAADYGCVPLAKRDLRIPDRRKALKASLIMVLAIGGTALGLPVAVSFAIGVLASMALRTVPPRAVYDRDVTAPVIVLLGALIPVAGDGIQRHADLIARFLMEPRRPRPRRIRPGGDPGGGDVSFRPDEQRRHGRRDVPDRHRHRDCTGRQCRPFLMAVAIGASCAFLTPIGHQNNTLILGPGGFRFGDYWRLGALLEILVIAIVISYCSWFGPSNSLTGEPARTAGTVGHCQTVSTWMGGDGSWSEAASWDTMWSVIHGRP